MKTHLTALFLVLMMTSSTWATLSCRDVVHPTPVFGSREHADWIRSFQGLRQRLKDRTSINPEFAMKLPLTDAEKARFYGSLSRVFQGVRTRLEPELARACNGCFGRRSRALSSRTDEMEP
ncbi:MAG: hypothetical protein ACK5Y2_07255 [Bdellovibrionales bacterium]